MEAGQALTLYEYEAESLSAEDVEVEVEYCGVCHSDLSMIDNEWGVSQYPVIAGHEVIGRVSALGDAAKNKASLLVSAWASAGPPKAANTATPALTATRSTV